MNNNRPVSNLCFIDKILEKLVLSQDSSYLNSHNLYNNCQSAYRPGHSTETALLKVVNDLFFSLNKGNISALALLDFSSAFDTIDHPIHVHRLHTDFGFTDTVLQWFSSYLTDRTHYVSLSNHCSVFTHVHSGVPQGSVLGPMLFTMYINVVMGSTYIEGEMRTNQWLPYGQWNTVNVVMGSTYIEGEMRTNQWLPHRKCNTVNVVMGSTYIEGKMRTNQWLPYRQWNTVNVVIGSTYIEGEMRTNQWLPNGQWNTVNVVMESTYIEGEMRTNQWLLYGQWNTVNIVMGSTYIEGQMRTTFSTTFVA